VALLDKVKHVQVKSINMADYDQLYDEPTEKKEWIMSEIINSEQLRQQALELRLYGLQAHWSELTEEHTPFLSKLIRWELDERQQRSLGG